MAAAAEEEMVHFRDMNEEQLRQWVEANPGRVNDRDGYGYTPLYVAVRDKRNLALTVWLVDEKGADVNTLLHLAPSLDILTALLDRVADPTSTNEYGWTVLMRQARRGNVENVTCLLQDPRIRATVNLRDVSGDTAFHLVCDNKEETEAISIIHLLLQAGSNPAITSNSGQTPLVDLRQRHPTHHAAIALLEQYPEAQKDAEKASLLIKARRLAVAAISNTVAPSCLQARVAQGQPLPRLLLGRMVLTSVTGGPDEKYEESRTLHSLCKFLLGMGGPKREGMPRDVFRVVLDLLMPSWDPLRRKNAGTAPPQVQQG